MTAQIVLQTNSPLETLFQDITLAKSLRFTGSRSWETAVPIQGSPDSMTLLGGDGLLNNVEFLFELKAEKCFVMVHLDHISGRVHLRLHGQDFKSIRIAYTKVLEWLPAEPRVENRLRISFWSLSPNGPSSVSRLIDVPSWGAVTHNYGSRSRHALQALIEMKNSLDSAGGKLILWHGEPGTGKTWALRALLEEWRDRVTPHYITDPDKFFGSSSTYMMQVLLGDNHEIPDAKHSEEPWRLLIMEDTGELLGRQAKQEVGQSLSRLLNVCDGLIGQGLRVLILITTNEKMESMHEAVTRRGRCLDIIEFGRLTPVEVAEWAEHTGRELPAERRTSPQLLADLYLAEDEGTFRPRPRQRVGFTV